MHKSSLQQAFCKLMGWVPVQEILEAIPHRLLDKAMVVAPKTGNGEHVDSSPHMRIATMSGTSLAHMLIDFKLLLINPSADVYF